MELPNQEWRSLGEGGRVTPLAPPGTYTVTLRAAGFELVQPLEVLKDPNSGGSELEIQEQVTMARRNSRVRGFRGRVDRPDRVDPGAAPAHAGR